MRLRALALCVPLLCCSGCGGAPRPRPVAATDLAPEQVGAHRVVVVERPMEGHVALTVWIDAGSLDGPNEALLAAEIVAAAGELDVLVTPDGTRLRRMCASAELERCVRELDAALGARGISDEALEAARERVAGRRARGASSSRREAEMLAAGAALGLSIEPLGVADTVPGREGVLAFLEAHYGADRALWIVVGDVARDRAEAAIERVDARAARAERARRTPTEQAPRTRASEHPGAGHWAIARRTPSEGEALAIANAWRARRGLATGVEVSAFPTRAGWVAMVSFARREGDAPMRWAGVAPWPVATREVPEGAFEIADRVGALWVTGAGAEVGERLGVAVVGRDAESTLASLEPARIPWESAASVAVPGAASLSIAWLLPGPAEDGASALGASRIAAEIFSLRCGQGAQVSVEGAGVFVVTTGSPVESRAVASVWADCVALSEPSVADVETARRALVARTTLDDERLAAAAAALAPRAPGVVASEGSAQALSDVAIEDVRARWRSWRDGGRWGLAGAVADASGPAPSADVSGGLEASTTRRERVAIDRQELVIIEAIPSCGNVAFGTALARAWARHARLLGLEVTWQRSGASSGAAWGAISARGDAGALGALASAELDPGARANVAEAAARLALEGLAELASTSELARRAAVGAAHARCESAPVRSSVWLEPHPTGARR